MKTHAAAYVVLSFLISVLATSCHKKMNALNTILLNVEKCMNDHPDSALNLLKAIPDPEELLGKTKADYALLMTQAMDKNYLKFSSDSLISIALNYYTVNRREVRMNAKSQFYYGRVMLELGKQEEALKYFLRAKIIYESVREYKMLALIAEEIGIINRQQEIYGDALNSFRDALTIHEKLNNPIGVVSSTKNIARIYLYMNEWDSCAYYYKYALNIAEKKQYKTEASILHELGILYRSIGDLHKAEHYFLASFEKEKDEEKKYKECLSIGYLYFQMRKFDNAKFYLELATNSSNLLTKKDVYDCLFKIAKHQELFQVAIVYNEKSDSISRIVNKLNSQSLIADLQKKYENEKLQNENLHMKVYYTHFILIGTVAFVIAILLTCYYYYKNRNNKRKIAEIERMFRRNEEEIGRYRYEIEEIYSSKEQILEDNKTKIGELNGKIMILTTQNKTLSDKLINFGGEVNVEMTPNSYPSTFRLLLGIKDGSYKGKLSNENRERLVELFDFLYLNYASRLREKYTLLTKHDLEICCLLKLGMTHEELSRVFNTTPDSVTKAKGRLKGRLGISSRDDLDDFLRDF